MQKTVMNQFVLSRGIADETGVFPDGTGEIRFIAPLPPGWYQSKVAVVLLKITSEFQPEICLGLAERNSTEPILNMHYRVLQNCQIQVPFPIDENALKMESYFLPPRPGVFKGSLQGRSVLPEEVHNVVIQISGKKLIRAEWPRIELMDEWQPSPVSGEPLVDEFGQRLRGSWPGKTESFEELRDYLHNELKRADSLSKSNYPADWSEWGGWKRKRFVKTGWFHCEQDERRWWLVDPDGYAFFSNGMCYGNRTGIYSMADHLDMLFRHIPEKDGIMSQAWTTGDKIPQYVVRNGLEDAKARTLVNFARVNMIRVFGDKWLDAWIKINSARMRSMGINTLGIGVNDYVDEFTAEFIKKAKIPYVITLKQFPLTTQCIFRDFPDVFSSEYAQVAEKLAKRQLEPYRDDPYMIGYFVTNEPEWLFYDDVNLCVQLMKCCGCTASKKALIAFLLERYASIKKLNLSWGTSFVAFDDLLGEFAIKEMTSDMKSDCDCFHKILVEKYCATISASLKQVDPHHLNLGMRYSALTEEKAEKIMCNNLNSFDVFSFNRYGAEPASPARILAKYSDIPCVVGEWHVGAADSGLDMWGLYYADSQSERAQAITYYLEQSTTEKNLVGVHYFEYSDQPYMGRFDGECYNIGIIDVCNRPYPLVMKAYQNFAPRMYPMLDGAIKPESEPVKIKHLGK